MDITHVAIGDTVHVELPYSEVCMSMRVAGARRDVHLVSENAAQILNEDGTPFSFPVLPGEAGLFHDATGFYTYAAPKAAAA